MKRQYIVLACWQEDNLDNRLDTCRAYKNRLGLTLWKPAQVFNTYKEAYNLKRNMENEVKRAKETVFWHRYQWVIVPIQNTK